MVTIRICSAESAPGSILERIKHFITCDAHNAQPQSRPPPPRTPRTPPNEYTELKATCARTRNFTSKHIASDYEANRCKPHSDTYLGIHCGDPLCVSNVLKSKYASSFTPRPEELNLKTNPIPSKIERSSTLEPLPALCVSTTEEARWPQKRISPARRFRPQHFIDKSSSPSRRLPDQKYRRRNAGRKKSEDESPTYTTDGDFVWATFCSDCHRERCVICPNGEVFEYEIKRGDCLLSEDDIQGQGGWKVCGPCAHGVCPGARLQIKWVWKSQREAHSIWNVKKKDKVKLRSASSKSFVIGISH